MRKCSCCIHFSSVAQLCPTLCDPMDHSPPGFPAHHQLPELTQTHVYRVGDAIQSSHFCRPLLLSPSIFPSMRVYSNESVLCIKWPKYRSFSFMASVLQMNIQDWFPLEWTGWISLQSKGLSRVFSSSTMQKHIGIHIYFQIVFSYSWDNDQGCNCCIIW